MLCRVLRRGTAIVRSFAKLWVPFRAVRSVA